MPTNMFHIIMTVVVVVTWEGGLTVIFMYILCIKYNEMNA